MLSQFSVVPAIACVRLPAAVAPGSRLMGVLFALVQGPRSCHRRLRGSGAHMRSCDNIVRLPATPNMGHRRLLHAKRRVLAHERRGEREDVMARRRLFDGLDVMQRQRLAGLRQCRSASRTSLGRAYEAHLGGARTTREVTRCAVLEDMRVEAACEGNPQRLQHQRERAPLCAVSRFRTVSPRPLATTPPCTAAPGPGAAAPWPPHHSAPRHTPTPVQLVLCEQACRVLQARRRTPARASATRRHVFLLVELTHVLA